MFTLATQVAVAIVATVLPVPLLRQRTSTQRALLHSASLALLASLIVTLFLTYGPGGHDLYTPKLAIFVVKYGVLYGAAWGGILLFVLAATGLIRFLGSR